MNDFGRCSLVLCFTVWEKTNNNGRDEKKKNEEVQFQVVFLFLMYRPGQNRFLRIKTVSSASKPFQTVSSVSKPFQTVSSVSKPFQTVSSVSKPLFGVF